MSRNTVTANFINFGKVYKVFGFRGGYMDWNSSLRGKSRLPHDYYYGAKVKALPLEGVADIDVVLP